jgi:hypothetical protein
MAAFTRTADLPNLHILVQTRNALAVYDTPTPPSIELPKKTGSNDFDITQETISSTNFPCTLGESSIAVPAAPRLTPFYDPSGRLLCVIPQGLNITLIDSKNPENRLEIPNSDAQSAYFSPRGGFLATWSLPSTTAKSGEGNFRVWSTTTVC